MDKLTLFLVDDHAVVRLGLRTLLEDISWVEIIGEAGSAAEALAAVAELQPDVVLMDIRLPDDSGVIACGKITAQWPDMRVIMLTSYSDDNLILRAKQAGACCYILKQVGNQALLDALEQMRAGDLNLDPIATQHGINQYHRVLRSQKGGMFKDLTEREMLVLLAITEGKTNPQIAAGLGISEQAISNAVNSVVRKLGVSNRFEAAIFAMQNNIRYFMPERSDEI